MRTRPCRWLGREPDGRPWCEHGRAHKAGDRWRCRAKKAAVDARYCHSEHGRAVRREYQHTDAQKSRKAIHELTRVRCK